MSINWYIDKIVQIQEKFVIIDCDVAILYGVETRDINKAVKNNPHKFPENYVIELSNLEKNELVKNFHRFSKLKHLSTNQLRSIKI